MQCHLSARRLWASRTDFCPCPLETDFTRLQCRWWDIPGHTFIHWGRSLLNCFKIWRCISSEIGEPLPMCVSEWLCLAKMLFLYPVIVTDLLLINSVSCKMFFLVYFPSLYFYFLDMLLPSNSKWVNIFHEKVKCLIIWHAFYVMLWINDGFLRFAYDCTQFLFTFLQCSTVSGFQIVLLTQTSLLDSSCTWTVWERR